jgi:Cap4 dsDNA endonuclease
VKADDPGSVLDANDPGDDVQHRFRYQHSFAAIQCLRLLDPSAAYTAVFCENHEDILLRRTNGKYDGVQVKTRKFERDRFAANDPDITRSIARFAALEKSFPNSFEQYHIVTNHGFWDDDETDRCLAYIIREIRGQGGLAGLSPQHKLRRYARSIAKQYGCDESCVGSALCKLALRGEKSDLDRPYRDLVQIIGELDAMRTQPSTVAYRVADNLIHLAYLASSKALGGPPGALHDLLVDYEEQKEKLTLAGKTLTPNQIQTAINEWIPDSAENLLISSGCVPDMGA